MQADNRTYILFVQRPKSAKRFYIAEYNNAVADNIVVDLTKRKQNAGRFPYDICHTIRAQFFQMGIALRLADCTDTQETTPQTEGRRMYGIRVETFAGTCYYGTRFGNHVDLSYMPARAARLCKSEAARVLEAINSDYPSAEVFEFPIVGGV